MLSKGLLYEDDVILAWMRNRYLQELVSGGRQKNANVKESLSRLNLHPYFTYPAIALLEPVSTAADDRGKMLRMEEMRDYVQQRASLDHVVFIDDRHRLALLFSWVSAKHLEAVQTMLGDRFGLPVNVGVGKPCSQLCDVHHSYRQAEGALQNKFYRGTGHIIQYGELPRYAALGDYPADMEKELHDALKAADSDADVEEAVEAFYRALLEQGPIDIKAMYELTARLLIGSEKKLLPGANYDSACKKFEIMSIVNMQTLQEIKACVSRFFIGVRGAMQPDQKESHRSIIKKTIQYMEQEYQAASLQSAAQKVYMTPTYLSLLFKLNTGTTFIEHLTRIRIQKAKELLDSTHYKNYEVAEQVGYQDPRYFSQIFKRKVGLSPTEYRELGGK
ncbi:helix-turn-helix domain-containing protein [Paenibacillus lycopersici]|uniref:Helix-turn-helix domain-containing protein n=1 Tax=Paenibacillus lycopersici TaxID=2704462 RepID=A0A6C0FR40_9BACL|nr:helix-turn-helix domain-containing protein [Paenibacillus lycopersici]QHT59606.1 helix-turn-helix domain-containing protein [Paenibacillus lycopersici]